jgi:hypothetical protein
MTPLETLKAARQLITDPAKWTQGEFARDVDGSASFALSERAHCYCALGALEKVIGRPDYTDAYDKLWRVCRTKFGTDVAAFNDTHTHAEVLALFDAAIAELEGV